MVDRRRGRPTERVIVSPSERTTLQQWTRRRTTAQGLAQRARIVLSCAAGRTDTEIARELDLRGNHHPTSRVGVTRFRVPRVPSSGFSQETRSSRVVLSRSPDLRAPVKPARCNRCKFETLKE